jgi:tRNA A-37 threonylcarbamoyl transferase component Bud32
LVWERLGRNEAFFAGEFLTGAAPWPDAVPAELLGRLAGTVRRLHAARFLHRDLHLGNVLVREEKPFLIDFHGGYFLPFLPRAWEARMLGMLVSSFRARDQTHLVAPFLRAYAGREDPGLAERVGRYASRHRRRHLASRSKRCVVDSTSFAVEGGRGRRVFRRRELAPARLEALLREPGRVVSSNRRGEVALLDEDGRGWCRKVVRYAFLRGLLARLVPAHLYRAWRGGNALAVHGVGVAKPYAYVRRVSFGALREEALLTEELRGFQPLTTLLQSCSARRLVEIGPTVARDLADFMSRFHRTRFWQHDLAPKNVMVRQRPDGSWEFRLIDLDGIRRSGLNRRRMLRNLVQLGSVPGVALRWLDRARFLKAYQDGALWRADVIRTLTAGILAEMFKRIVRESERDLAAALGKESPR